MIIMEQKHYLCIDLKSFFASVECVDRGLDPMTARLIVADPERGRGTVCLAVSPALKAEGIRNRCRLFEVPEKTEFIMAPPRMRRYIEYSAEVYGVYLSFFSKDDIYVYSVDEAFIDVTPYLGLYRCTASALGKRVMDEITLRTGLRAACGCGTNLYLAKVALDITAKHSPDFIGILNEESYKQTLWDHKPLTDFWRVGAGTERKLKDYGITTMGGIAAASEDFLYRLFGIDAELLIDHAWGREPTTIADIKKYKPDKRSISSGQVLMRDYSFDEARVIVKEMIDALCLELSEKHFIAASVTLHIGYSNTVDISPAHGTFSLDPPTNAYSEMIPKAEKLYEKIVKSNIPVRRLNITCNDLSDEECSQMCFFDESSGRKRSGQIQRTMLEVKNKFGRAAIFKGMDLGESATALERNRQIGGHRSGE